MAVDLSRRYHTGVRVPDLDAAMKELTDGVGLSWAAPQQRAQGVWTPSTGSIEVPLRFTYSAEGPDHIELLEGAAGSIWDGREVPGPHHIGVWSDDVVADTEALVAQGWTLAAGQKAPDEGYGAFTYIVPPSGLIVELVASFLRPAFERWWAGAPTIG